MSVKTNKSASPPLSGMSELTALMRERETERGMDSRPSRGYINRLTLQRLKKGE